MEYFCKYRQGDDGRLYSVLDETGGGSGHSPYIGDNGNWFEWDAQTGEYTDTGVKAQGEDGQDAPPTIIETGVAHKTNEVRNGKPVWCKEIVTTISKGSNDMLIDELNIDDVWLDYANSYLQSSLNEFGYRWTLGVSRFTSSTDYSDTNIRREPLMIRSKLQYPTNITYTGHFVVKFTKTTD